MTDVPEEFKYVCIMCAHFIINLQIITLSLNVSINPVNFNAHLSSDCQQGVSPNSSLRDLIETSPEIPLSSEEDKLTTALIKRKLSDNPIVHLKTGGQVNLLNKEQLSHKISFHSQ